eukprot:6800301-Heterocapsa_arctica.AAC.1
MEDDDELGPRKKRGVLSPERSLGHHRGRVEPLPAGPPGLSLLPWTLGTPSTACSATAPVSPEEQTTIDMLNAE